MGLLAKGDYGGWFVYHTEDFETKCKAAGAKFRRFQTVWSSLRTLITVDPSQAGIVGEGQDGVVVFDGDPGYSLPKLRVRYRYGNCKIVMIDLDCQMLSMPDSP